MINLSTPFWEDEGTWNLKDFKHWQIPYSCYTRLDRLPFQPGSYQQKWPAPHSCRDSPSGLPEARWISKDPKDFSCCLLFTEVFISKYFQGMELNIVRYSSSKTTCRDNSKKWPACTGIFFPTSAIRSWLSISKQAALHVPAQGKCKYLT